MHRKIQSQFRPYSELPGIRHDLVKAKIGRTINICCSRAIPIDEWMDLLTITGLRIIFGPDDEGDGIGIAVLDPGSGGRPLVIYFLIDALVEGIPTYFQSCIRRMGSPLVKF